MRTLFIKPQSSEIAEVKALEPRRRAALASESSLRVAARTLSSARPSEITATRVVGVLGRDDPTDFRTLVASISQEFGIEAQTRIHQGSFSVRFSRAL